MRGGGGWPPYQAYVICVDQPTVLFGILGTENQQAFWRRCDSGKAKVQRKKNPVDMADMSGNTAHNSRLINRVAPRLEFRVMLFVTL